MSAITVKHFDALGYVRKSKELGVPEHIAEYQARQMEEILEIAINSGKTEIQNQELASKKDIELTRKDIELSKKELELKIEQVNVAVHKSKYEVVIWVAGLFLANGLLNHFFK